jgi:glycosyltransferase involved in cell wall biosynthesis
VVITESGAGICVPWEENAFADAIVKLLSYPEIAEEMGHKGRRYVEKHRDYEAIAGVVENEYYRIKTGRVQFY